MYQQMREDEKSSARNNRSGICDGVMLLLGGLMSLFSLLLFGKVSAKGRLEAIMTSAEDSQLVKLKAEAIDGDPQKQLRLGVMYAAGVEGWTDYRGAIFWLRKAAEQGEPNAQMLISMLYLEGLGARRNYMQAARWARLSALQGNIVAQLLMGALLEDGAGVRRDLERAAYWYAFAARNPVEIGARQRLGTFYLQGIGVGQDVETGLKWLNESAEMGDANARFQLGMLYYDGRQVERDYEKALHWYMAAANATLPEKGEGAIDVILGPAAIPGEVYTRTIGQIMKRNPHVIRDARFYVGLMYETGRGTGQDLPLARNWYEKAAEAGDEISRQRLVFLKDVV